MSDADLSAAPPVSDLLRRIPEELAIDFAQRPIHIGLASLPDAPDQAAAVALAPRSDRQVQVFSFNLYDRHLPFTLRVPLDTLANCTLEQLRAAFAEPGHPFAIPLAGPLATLHHRKLIDLRAPQHTGYTLAVLSTIPDRDVAADAAITAATITNLVDYLDLRGKLDASQIVSLCHDVLQNLSAKPQEMPTTLRTEIFVRSASRV